MPPILSKDSANRRQYKINLFIFIVIVEVLHAFCIGNEMELFRI